MRILKKASTLGLLSAAMLCGSPFSAQANDAVVQTGTQEAIIDGNNNQVIQVINQVNIEHPGRGHGRGRSNRRGDTAVVQDTYQGATVYGDGNTVIQETTQENRVRQEHPGRGRGSWRHDDDDDGGNSRGNGRGRGRGHDDDDDDD